MMFVSRNEALGIPQRTKRNLEYVRESFSQGADVHLVTALVTSLLGLVVLPWEHHLVESSRQVTLKELSERGWPSWKITLGSAETLHYLIRRIRNATAHGRIRFSSDSRELSEVTITVEDVRQNETLAFWRAEIGGEELYAFCLLFIEYIEDTIG